MLKEKLDKVLLDFAKKVEMEILAGRTKTLNIDKYTHKIVVLGEIVEVWVCNDIETNYGCLLVKYGMDNDCLYFPKNVFNKPLECYNITKNIEDKIIDKQIEEIEKKKEYLQSLRQNNV